MTEEHFVTREECQRIHAILDESRRVNIAESKKDRDGLRERYDVGLKWIVGLFITFMLGAGGIMIQNWQRSSAVYETRDLSREAIGRIEIMDEKVDRLDARSLRIDDELRTHMKKATERDQKIDKAIQGQKDKHSNLDCDFAAHYVLSIPKVEPIETEDIINVDDIGRVEYEQAIRDVVIKQYTTTPPDNRKPEWYELHQR